MTDDLVKRLRAEVSALTGTTPRICADAADALTRLTAENAELQSVLAKAVEATNAGGRLAIELRAENARLVERGEALRRSHLVDDGNGEFHCGICGLEGSDDANEEHEDGCIAAPEPRKEGS